MCKEVVGTKDHYIRTFLKVESWILVVHVLPNFQFLVHIESRKPLWFLLNYYNFSFLCIFAHCVKSSNAYGLFKYGASTTHNGHHMETSKSTHTISPALSTSFKKDVVISQSIQCTPTTTQLEVDNEVGSRKCTLESTKDHSYQVVNLFESPLFTTTILCVDKAKLHSTTTHPECRICSQENPTLVMLEVNMILYIGAFFSHGLLLDFPP